MQTPKKDTFIFRSEWINALKLLNGAEIIQILSLLCEMVETGESEIPSPEKHAPSLSATGKAVYSIMAASVLKDYKKYLDICERNRQKMIDRWNKEKTD